MKYTLTFIICLSLFPSHLFCQIKPHTHSNNFGGEYYLGKVKKMKEFKYSVKDKFGEIVKANLEYVQTESYDLKGNILEELDSGDITGNNANLLYRKTYKYNDTGKIIEYNIFDVYNRTTFVDLIEG